MKRTERLEMPMTPMKPRRIPSQRIDVESSKVCCELFPEFDSIQSKNARVYNETMFGHREDLHELVRKSTVPLSPLPTKAGERAFRIRSIEHEKIRLPSF
jgi:hypothetical protein